MNKQFSNSPTFFDLGFENIDEKDISTMKCISYGLKKKRITYNKLIIDYLKGKELSKEQLDIVHSILDGSIYIQNRQKYNHCKLCSNEFQIDYIKETSKDYKYWDLGYPTVPYFPAGFMIYLKNRASLKIENIQDLTLPEIEELKKIIVLTYNKLNMQLFNGELSGINVLFNQISKSELCIHGHVELMIKDIDKLKLGCKLEHYLPADPITKVINEQLFNSESILKSSQGIRIPFDNSEQAALKILAEYEKIIKSTVTRSKSIITPMYEIDERLKNNLNPAPTNSVYLTYYQGKFVLSSVPSVTLDTITTSQLVPTDEQVYCLKINQYANNPESLLM